jgi:signal transduction histidine kinase
VDDLLTLAKAEQPGFVVAKPTDLARLTDETLAKAATLGERRWVLDGLADVSVMLDPQRITQAWLQLAANAVQYSEPASTVAIGSRAEDGEVRLWVRDEGVGIPEPEQARVLERAVLGRWGSGTGFGLAIVASIAKAHDGRVEVASAVGVGSRISMVLPAAQDQVAAKAAASSSQPEEGNPD